MNANRLLIALSVVLYSSQVLSAISPDRTRAIVSKDDRSVVLTLTNGNENHPYLSQSWLEDKNGNKVINGPLIVLPPLQRIEAGSKSTIRIISTDAALKLPTDRETVFYLNIREIPPIVSDNSSLTLSLQTRLKVMYRPEAVSRESMENAYKKISVMTTGNATNLKNNTPFFLTVVDIRNGNGIKSYDRFEPFMSDPYSNMDLGELKLPDKGRIDVFYINDYGGRQKITLNCQERKCDAN
ncbi:molecular chaperone [Pantoea endophytica]|uniref:Fimbria/pilus periplasmic chaperone n=1 Tax=Pantoea sp. BJ2 TaxID=3141322 RepID=A0AAU7U3Q4_9GAMM